MLGIEALADIFELALFRPSLLPTSVPVHCILRIMLLDKPTNFSWGRKSDIMVALESTARDVVRHHSFEAVRAAMQVGIVWFESRQVRQFEML